MKNEIKQLINNCSHYLSSAKLKILIQVKHYEYYNLTSLAESLSMSLPCLCFHINGATHRRGLIELGYIKTKEPGKNKRYVTIKLTRLGFKVIQKHLRG